MKTLLEYLNSRMNIFEDEELEDLDAEGGEESDNKELPKPEDTLSNTVEDEIEENPDKQGLIRFVPNAHLVYKRVQPDGTFSELWIYNIYGLNDELEIKKSILAGTDIDIKTSTDDSGNQEYQLFTMGNAQLMHITGLPN
jgi:hypothetical protein